jgi:hypothetical protein
MSLPVFLGIAALLLGVVGFGRAAAEFGLPGVIAYSKLVLSPSLVVIFFLFWTSGSFAGKFPRSLLPSNHALKKHSIVVVVLTGIAMVFSALFGVGWLVTR